MLISKQSLISEFILRWIYIYIHKANLKKIFCKFQNQAAVTIYRKTLFRMITYFIFVEIDNTFKYKIFSK